MSWLSSSLCPKCKIMLNSHIISRLKLVVKYSTISHTEDVSALLQLGFSPKMIEKIYLKLVPRAVETKSFLKAAKLLQDWGFTNQDISASPLVLNVFPTFLKHRWNLLEEVGFIKEKIPIDWMRMRKATKLTETKLYDIKLAGLIDQNTNCAQNIVSFTDLPSDFYPDYIDENLPFSEFQARANQVYLGWKLNLGQVEMREKYTRYHNLYLRSIRIMSENIETLNKQAGFSMDKIASNIYLLQFNPEMFLEVLQEVPMIGSTPICEILDIHPKVIMRPASVIKNIISTLEEFKIPLESLKRFASLLTLAPETVRERIEELNKDPFYKPYFYHPRICKFIVQYEKVKKRSKHLTEAGWKCQSLDLLSNADKCYNDRVEVGCDRSFGHNTIYYLMQALELEWAEVKRLLSQNAQWLYVQTPTVIENLKYLQEAGFDNKQIIQGLPVLLYPTNSVQVCVEELESKPEVDCCRGEDGKIKPELHLHLVLYYLEQPFKFTGNGIWELPQDQENKPVDDLH